MWLAILLLILMLSSESADAGTKSQDAAIGCRLLHLDLSPSWQLLSGHQDGDSETGGLYFTRIYTNAINKCTLTVSYNRSQLTRGVAEAIMNRPAHELSQDEQNSLKHAGAGAEIFAWSPVRTRDFGSRRFLTRTRAIPIKAMTAFPNGSRGCVNLTRHTMEAIYPAPRSMLILSCSLDEKGFHGQSHDIEKQLAEEMEHILSTAAWNSN